MGKTNHVIIEAEPTSLRFRNKIQWISLICAVMVLFIHGYGIAEDTGPVFAAKIERFLSKNLASAAVPMFSAMSAFLFYRNFEIPNLWCKLKRRFHSLVIPYLFWNTMYMVVFFFLGRTPFVHMEPFALTPKAILRGILLHEFNYPYWFMLQLILCTMMCPLIDRLIRYRVVGIAVILSLILCYGVGWNRAGIFDLSFLVFYLIGAFCGKHLRKAIMEQGISPFLGIAAFVLSQIVFELCAERQGGWELAHNFLLMVSVLSVAELASGKQVPSVLRDTFPIYTLHGIVLEVFNKLFGFVIPGTSNFILVDYFLSPLLTIGSIAAVCRILKKSIPKFFAFAFGGRGSHRE